MTQRLQNPGEGAAVPRPGAGAVDLKSFSYSGFGHFATAGKEIPLLWRLGSDLVEQERGPRDMNSNGTLSAEALSIKTTLGSGAKAGVKVDVLLSPHYFPAWAMKKAADIQNKDAIGAIKFNIDHPVARQVIQEWLTAFLPVIKDSPALFGVCLENEPTYQLSGRDPYSRAAWTQYLQDHHPTIADLNTLYGTQFASFDQVPVPEPEMPGNLNAARSYYDWVRFNQEHFAAWFSWMNATVKAVAPSVPTHVKIMAYIFDRTRLSYGIDPELICQITDLAGNDCWAFPGATNGYAYNWQTEEMWYDLLYSFRSQPVFNSENHLIADRTPATHVAPEHTHCVLWQGSLHHQAATAVWTWEEAFAPDLHGSIYFRPANAYAAGAAMLDANRLAAELSAVNANPAKIAILYSVPSLFWEGDYPKAAAAAYSALNFLGQPITFISENQLVSGNRSAANQNVQWLILPRATHVTEKAFAGLLAFVKNDGKLLAMGANNAAFDEYGRTRGETLPASAIDWTGSVKDSDFSAALSAFLATQGYPLAKLTMADQGTPAWGIEYRTVPAAAGTLVPMTNLLNQSQTVNIPVSGSAVDLLQGNKISGSTIELAPMQSVLLQVSSP